jgi:5'-nucleotidase
MKSKYFEVMENPMKKRNRSEMNFGRWPRRFYAMTALFVLLSAMLKTHLDASSIVQGQTDCPVRVTLLQLNDVYQYPPVEGGKRGGLARILTLRREIMKESPNTLFLLAGDTISPSVESNSYKGKQMIDAWNLSGLDYATFGNHEFDFGPDILKARIAESNFKWLAANVIDKQTGKLFANTPEFVIREFDGVKIGLFGIVLQETLETSRPGPTVNILDPCATATRVVPEIHAAGAKVVIALTHETIADDKELARCSGADLIIGGHEHTLLESLAGHAPILKMDADARELGRIDLNISKRTGELESMDWQIIPVTDQIKDDPTFASLDRKYGDLMKALAEPAGRTEVELDVKSADVRVEETNMADFIADAFRAAVGADVALVNGGSIRADQSFRPAMLTKREVPSILPFNSRVVKLQVTGAVIKAALEHGVATAAEEIQPGRFPQVSGLSYSFDASRKPGSRILDVMVNSQPLDLKRNYTLATTNYLAIEHGDGYDMLGTNFLIEPEQGPVDSELLLRAIFSAKAIAPRTDGRIKRIDAGKNSNACK